MENTLQIILIIYACALLANCISTFFLWTHQKSSLYKILLIIWSTCFVNFALQGVFQNPGPAMLISFGTYIFCAVALADLFYSAQRLTFSKRPYYIFHGITLAIGCALWFASGNFTYSAIPVAIGVALPMLVTSLKALIYRRNHDSPSRLFAVLLFVNSLHFLDYPVLRMQGPLGASIGFSIALMIIFCLSIFLPAFILRNVNREFTEKLQHQVEERTLSLTQKNKELRELGREHISLINIVCHDLATPLSVLNTCSYYIESSISEEEKQKFTKYLEMSQRSLRAVNDILEKVKNLQALKTGKIQVDLKPVNLLNELKESVAFFSDRLREKNLQIRWDYQLPPEVRIQADPVILRNQIVNNLLSNAIKFSEENGDIRIRAVLGDHGIRLSIEDTGVGIPAPLLAQIFEFETSTTRQGTRGERGTGFGLPMVKTCVEKFGGQIQVLSQIKDPTLPESLKTHGSAFLIDFKKAA